MPLYLATHLGSAKPFLLYRVISCLSGSSLNLLSRSFCSSFNKYQYYSLCYKMYGTAMKKRIGTNITSFIEAFLTGFHTTFSHYYLFWHPLSFTCLHIALAMGVLAGGRAEITVRWPAVSWEVSLTCYYVYTCTQFWPNTSDPPGRPRRHYLPHEVFPNDRIWGSVCSFYVLCPTVLPLSTLCWQPFQSLPDLTLQTL